MNLKKMVNIKTLSSLQPVGVTCTIAMHWLIIKVNNKFNVPMTADGRAKYLQTYLTMTKVTKGFWWLICQM